MSAFFVEDTVAFKTNHSIIGTVERVWNDVEQEDSFDEPRKCYLHKDLPAKVRKAWFGKVDLTPGYVIVGFTLDYDGYCIVSEDSLLLVDRALAVGDIVKRLPTDSQSGTVTSTSMMCELDALCTETDYNAQQYAQAQGHTSTSRPDPPRHRSESFSDRLIHGFPPAAFRSIDLVDSQPHSSHLQVPAQALTYCNNYREEDYILYHDWVGQIESVSNEVAVRLTNGSVVVVEDPRELQEPYWVPGTRAHELVQRLDRAGYHRYHVGNSAKPQAEDVDPSFCYPGQQVQTKKGNLRRGKWKFGAYDPAVSPRGIVVDVRCVGLEVSWLCPNHSLPLRSQAHPPPNLLETDELESGEVIVYDRSRAPRCPAEAELPNASYSPDTGFGFRIRFKDPVGAALKYRQTPLQPRMYQSSTTELGFPSTPPQNFDRIPRLRTQGFDMNVLQVTKTSTKVLIRWQDCTTTEEDAVRLHPYLNPDEHDVWPGDRISLKAKEERLEANDPGAVRAHKIGIVQRVDAIGRMAQVRWYLNAMVYLDEERSWQIHGSKYGDIGDEIEELPLYDIAAHPALEVNRGDMAIILPDSTPSSTFHGVGSALVQMFGFGTPHSQPSDEDDLISSDSMPHRPHDTRRSCEWFGEIIEACLDGDIIIRFGAAQEIHDIKMSAERVLHVISDDTESDSEYTHGSNYDPNWSSLSDSTADDEVESDERSAIDVSFEYEGGDKIPGLGDEDEEMWTTDEDQVDEPPAQADIVGLADHETTCQSTTEGPISYSNHPSMPPQFCVLDIAAPSDHHFAGSTTPLTADLMRRIAKENAILKRSLPDGVFVRTWDARIDLLRVLIVGPFDTPYEFAPFVMDLQYGVDFPTSPPNIFFHSWTNNIGRINPNLYEDGKICLSLLGTWTGVNSNEHWSSKKSTVLQLLVSLMGLVLVKEPYYNEAGYDVLVGSEESHLPSTLYNEKAYVMSKGFIKTALSEPPQGLEEIIAWLYLREPGPNLLSRVIDDSKRLLPETKTVESSSRSVEEIGESIIPKLSAGALVLLRRNLTYLEDRLREKTNE